jgi:hypothetical protein
LEGGLTDDGTDASRLSGPFRLVQHASSEQMIEALFQQAKAVERVAYETNCQPAKRNAAS